MAPIPEYPALGHLLRAYLYQLYDEVEYENEDAAIADYLRGEARHVEELPAEIEMILRRHGSEESLRELFTRLGAHYVFTGPAGDTRSWLGELRRRAEAHLAGS